MAKHLDRIGYHVRDYFVKQWDRFKDETWGILAHCTHLRGVGEYDVETRCGNTADQGHPGNRQYPKSAARRSIWAIWIRQVLIWMIGKTGRKKAFSSFHAPVNSFIV